MSELGLKNDKTYAVQGAQAEADVECTEALEPLCCVVTLGRISAFGPSIDGDYY